MEIKVIIIIQQLLLHLSQLERKQTHQYIYIVFCYRWTLPFTFWDVFKVVSKLFCGSFYAILLIVITLMKFHLNCRRWSLQICYATQAVAKERPEWDSNQLSPVWAWIFQTFPLLLLK